MRKYRNRKSERHIWSRLLAVLVIAATFLTGFDISLLDSVFAQETSGYRIEVSYSDDKSQAFLKGNTDSLRTGVTLGDLKDAEGNTSDPSGFEAAVTENGTYTYTLTYQETASQTGKQIDKEEKVTVQVDQIAAAAEETQAASAKKEQSALGKETRSGQASTASSTEAAENTQQADAGETPTAVELSVLEQSLAETRAVTTTEAQIEVKQYAAESVTVNLNSNGEKVYSPGGSLIDGDTESVPDYVGTPERRFTKAAFVYTNAPENMVELSGLYPLYNTTTQKYDWYYTTKAIDESNGGSGTDDVSDNIKVGYLIPDGVDIRFYYELTADQTYTITTSASADFELGISGAEQVQNSTNQFSAKEGTWVVATMTLSDGWWWAKAAATATSGTSGYHGEWSLQRTARPPESAQNPPTNKAELIDGNTGRYRVIFQMPAGNVTFSLTGTSYDDDGDNVIWFGLGTTSGGTSDDFHQHEMGATRFYTISKTSNTYTTGQPGRLQYTSRSGESPGYGGFGTYQSGGKPYLNMEAWKLNENERNKHTTMEYRGDLKKGNQQYQVSGANASEQVINTIYENRNGNITNVPVVLGDTVPGGTVQLRLEVGRGLIPLWQYPPLSVDLDVYEAGGQYQTENFTRYTFNLPRTAGQSVDEDLPGGGHIKIVCRAANDAKATDTYGVELNQTFGRNYGNLPNWYTYDITVSGVATDWKIIYNQMSTQQSSIFSNFTGGVVEGSGSRTGTTTTTLLGRIKGSYIKYRAGKNTTEINLYRPFLSGMEFWTNEFRGGEHNSSISTANYVTMGIDILDGYSKPNITVTGLPGVTSNVNYIGLTRRGLTSYGDFYRYEYQVTINMNGVTNTATSAAAILNIDSQPVEYSVGYYDDQGSKYYTPTSSSGDLVLKYDGIENYIVQPQLDSKTTNLRGYQLQIHYTDKTGSKQNFNINYNSIYGGSETLWLPGSMLDVRKIYSYMETPGSVKLADGVANYEIRLVPQQAQDGQSAWLVGGIGFTTYQQTDWFALNDGERSYDSVTEENKKIALGGQNTRYRDGYSNSEVVFGNYPNVLDTGEETYLLDEDRSKLSGTIGGSRAIVGEFYYLNAAQIEIKVDSEVNSASGFSAAKAAIDAWNQANGETWYTGVNGGPNQTADLSSIALPDEVTTQSGKTYEKVGWRIVKNPSQPVSNAGNLYQYAGITTSLNLYTLGTNAGDTETAGRDAWNAIFGSGVGNNRTAGSGKVILTPYYESGVKKVTLPDNTTTGDSSNTNYTIVSVKTGSNHQFKVQATFKYDDTAEAFDIVKNADQLFVALYEQTNTNSGDADGTGDFSFVKGTRNVTRSPSASATLVSDPVISGLNTTDKTFTVTFTVTDETNLTTANGYANYNHKDYQIVAWTEANEATSFTGSGAVPASLRDEEDFEKVPQVRNKIYVQKPITVTTGYDARTEKFYEDTGSFTTSFDYDNRSEFTKGSSVKYAIYRVQGSNNALGICEAGTINLETGAVTRRTDNYYYGTVASVTANLSGDHIELTIGLNSSEQVSGSIYKVYVWNESNGDVSVFTGNSIIQEYKTSDAGLSGYPLSSITILKMPKVYTNGTADISQTTINKMFYDGDNLPISASFTLEGNGTNKETINKLLTGADNVGELKVALYKVNPSSQGVPGYQLFALAESNGSGSLRTTYRATTIGDADITPNGNTGFTVTFTKTKGEYQWDDGASYYIYAWTGANADNLPGNFGTGGDNTIVTDNDIATANRLIPSVKTSMLGILTDEHFGEIIHYPKQITMMDNVKPNDKHIFSANQKITMTPLKVEEGGQMVDAEVPNPDSGVDVVIEEIRDNQDVENSIQVSRTVGSSDETINLTCFLGTIELNGVQIGTDGKVGTLYFADRKNELPLYFRSSTPPDVADGAPFTGQIHFVFSKSVSGN